MILLDTDNNQGTLDPHLLQCYQKTTCTFTLTIMQKDGSEKTNQESVQYP